MVDYAPGYCVQIPRMPKYYISKHLMNLMLVSWSRKFIVVFFTCFGGLHFIANMLAEFNAAILKIGYFTQIA